MDLNLDFTDEQLKRYSRHIILPQLGGIGQAKLLASKVLIVGAGALGSPTALYLAAAGVGTIGIIDMDTVDLSNLQRQVIHSQDTVGMLKVESAKERIQKLNSDVKVNTYVLMLTRDNIMDIMKDYDIVIDATDNFQTRYLINDACVLLGKPNIYGSILQFEGQTTVFNPPEGPCYRCLYPEPPPPGWYHHVRRAVSSVWYRVLSVHSRLSKLSSSSSAKVNLLPAGSSFSMLSKESFAG